MKRECGTCTVCCKVYEIPALQKPENTWCKHCNIGQGCSIYEQRPAPCKAFNCFWLQESQLVERAQYAPLMAEEMRPDKSGVAVSLMEPTMTRVGRVQIVVLKEAVEHAFDSKRGREVVNLFGNRSLVLLLETSGRKTLIGPPRLREHLLAWQEAQPTPTN